MQHGYIITLELTNTALMGIIFLFMIYNFLLVQLAPYFKKHIGKLFHDKDFTLISVDIRHILGDNQLARWLYNFYESHNEPIPFSIEFIQKLCRSEAEPKEFKRMIRTSLELVKRAHYLVNSKSKWDYEITEKGYLIINKKGKNIIQAKLF